MEEMAIFVLTHQTPLFLHHSPNPKEFSSLKHFVRVYRVYIFFSLKDNNVPVFLSGTVEVVVKNRFKKKTGICVYRKKSGTIAC